MAPTDQRAEGNTRTSLTYSAVPNAGAATTRSPMDPSSMSRAVANSMEAADILDKKVKEEK